MRLRFSSLFRRYSRTITAANRWISLRLALSVTLQTLSRTAILSHFFWPNGLRRAWSHGRVMTRKQRRRSSGHVRCVIRSPIFGSYAHSSPPVGGQARNGMSSVVSTRLTFFLHSISLSPCLPSTLVDVIPPLIFLSSRYTLSTPPLCFLFFFHATVS